MKNDIVTTHFQYDIFEEWYRYNELLVMWCRRMISLQEEWYHLMISTTLEWYRYNELLLIWYRRMISLQEEWYQIFNNDIVLWCTDIELISYRKNDIVTRRMISKNDIEVLKNDIEYFQEWYRYKKLTQLNWYQTDIELFALHESVDSEVISADITMISITGICWYPVNRRMISLQKER